MNSIFLVKMLKISKKFIFVGLLLISGCKDTPSDGEIQIISKTEKFSKGAEVEDHATVSDKMALLIEDVVSQKSIKLSEIAKVWDLYTFELDEVQDVSEDTIEAIEQKGLVERSKFTNYYDHKIIALLAMAASQSEKGKFYNVSQLFLKRANQAVITKTDLIIYHTFRRDFQDFRFRGDSLDVEGLKKLSKSRNPLYRYLAIELSASIVEGQDTEGGPTQRYEQASKEMLPVYISYLDEKSDLLVREALDAIGYVKTDEATAALKNASDKFRHHQEISRIIKIMLKEREE